MITFLVSILLLVVGFFVYGKFAERVFGIDEKRPTPAITMNDGVDYVPLSWGKIFLIQFLNIAGLGPIFGAVAGAMWGPVVFIWIVVGCIFGGAIHDFYSGMMSVRSNGISIPEIVGKNLGNGIKHFMRIFTVLLMVLVGAVFIMGPAKILEGLTNGAVPLVLWAILIFIYYVFATLLPVDKIIGKIYPFFGFVLLFMAVGITLALIFQGYNIPELSFENFANFHDNSDKFPIFPMLFVTVACGAVSGFHSTQSPLMARCITNEKQGRKVFYGAMIAEGIVALIWAAAGMSFFGGVKELNAIMAEHNGNAAWIVNEISNTLLGKFGAILAILGIVAAPITSGDTAFRSARLIIADFLNIKQSKIKMRILVSLPLFVVGFLLTQFDFAIIWRYMAWSNQTLAAIVLWAITVYLALNKKLYIISLIPAIFMTAVCIAYILVAPEGLKLEMNLSVIISLCVTLLISILFFFKIKNKV